MRLIGRKFYQTPPSMQKHYLLFMCILLIVCDVSSAHGRDGTAVYSLQQSISGQVLDESSVPLPGVNVLIKGTTTGAVTDADGKFSLSGDVASDAILIFSFIGYKSVEV